MFIFLIAPTFRSGKEKTQNSGALAPLLKNLFRQSYFIFISYIRNMSSINKSVFITGGTGYMGSRLIPRLIVDGYNVHALVREGSEKKLPTGTDIVFGNAFDRTTFADKVKGSDTFVQLIGVAHPSPAKAEEFKKIDLVSVTESVAAAKEAGVKHFVYLSVAEPAPIMKDYIAVRKQGETPIEQSGMHATYVKPWYVLGPGHWWPYAILPIIKLLQFIPSTRDGATRLEPVKLSQMINTLVYAVENPASGIRKFSTEEIKGF